MLEPAQFGGWGGLGEVLVGDPGMGQGRLQPERVRPAVLGSADTAALTYVERKADVCVPKWPQSPQSPQEELAVEP
ncbi:hypothetical protein ACF08N_33390 [Streptomyces sp. NPDC015127]|uniref:hypothetical protein n=1 Tax=Streptomyces sp. NPDC015127 TaxID=3364939 RepID=UPI0036F9E91C